MTFFLIAVVVIIIVAVSVQINNLTSEHDASYDLVTKEVISLLETLQAFYKHSYNDFCSNVYIIPIDLSGNLYGYTTEGKRNAEKIQIDLLIIDKVDNNLLDIIKYISHQTGADEFFKLTDRDGSTFFTAVSTYRFNGKFKKFMPYLHKAVVERFPELNIEFDGSRIIIHHM